MEGASVRNKIDFAPGENHIALRYPNKCFYVPEVFHMAPTDGKIIPLFISDINKSRSILEIYGSKGFDKYVNNFIMINNYPIKKVKVTGKIIGEKFKDYSDWGEPNSKNYVRATVDDFSSDKLLTIEVKVKESLFLSAGLVFNTSYGKIVEVTGVVNDLGNKRELLADYISIIGDNDELDLEIECWKEKLEFRKSILSSPWIYEPPKLTYTPVTYSEPKLLKKDYDRENFKRNIVTIDVDSDNDFKPRIFREDSILLTQHTRSFHNVIDLTDDIIENEKPELSKNANRNSESKNREVDVDVVSDSEVQILDASQVHSHVNNAGGPGQVIEEFQLTLEFVTWILQYGHSSFKLADIYNYSKVSQLLEILARSKLSMEPVDANNPDYFKNTKHKIFHSIRRLLHINYRLIDVSQNQDVNPHNLYQLTDHLKYCLNILKLHKINEDKTTVLNVESYLRIFKIHSNNLIGDIDYRLINGVIDWILTNDFNNRKDWKYDSKMIEWCYVA